MKKLEIKQCKYCGSPAVAELDGDYLCPGCLMAYAANQAPEQRPLERPQPIPPKTGKERSTSQT